MGKQYEKIDGRLREFILAQPVFFVGTAPSGPDGQLNISPKGLLGSFAVLDGHRVAYLDYGGSGAETIAHLRDDGRIVLMFCAFAGPPNIVRLHGRGTVHFDDTPRFAELLPLFGEPATLPRTIIEIAVSRVADSCGYSVPLMSYEGDRDLLPRYWERKTPQDVRRYRAEKNATSIDGLPAMPVTEPSSADMAGCSRSDRLRG
jgi:Pyridoxamine 5'-phosphate oxidase